MVPDSSRRVRLVLTAVAALALLAFTTAVPRAQAEKTNPLAGNVAAIAQGKNITDGSRSSCRASTTSPVRPSAPVAASAPCARSTR